MIDKPKVGQVWERDGEKREVTGVDVQPICNPQEGNYWVTWVIRGETIEYFTWLPTWIYWKQEAHLVKEEDDE